MQKNCRTGRLSFILFMLRGERVTREVEFRDQCVYRLM